MVRRNSGLRSGRIFFHFQSFRSRAITLSCRETSSTEWICRKYLQQHKQSGSRNSRLPPTPVTREDAKRPGQFSVWTPRENIVAFSGEARAPDKDIEDFPDTGRQPCPPEDKKNCAEILPGFNGVSIFFNAAAMEEALANEKADFGKENHSGFHRQEKMLKAYLYRGYWEDIGNDSELL